MDIIKNKWSTGMFVGVFLGGMIPTYFYRWMFGGAMFADAMVTGGRGIGGMSAILYLFLIASYAAMIFAAYKKGSQENKLWIITFPIVAAVFDIILVFIPFIPTIMNLLAIVFGIVDIGKKK
jgi:hypothetical protein